jgi:hopanoid-associated phosphorylase
MLIVVTGMQREARIVGRGGETVISGGDVAGLAEKIERATSRGARALVSAGICGGLAPALSVGSIVIADAVIANDLHIPVDTRWANELASRLPQAVRGTIAGSDAIVSAAVDKAALHRETGALAADMESHVAARVAAAHGLPFAALRVVSDSAVQSLPPAVARALGPDGSPRIGAVLASVAANPAQILALLRTARDSERAFTTLLRCLGRVGVTFACPYLG